MVDLICPLKAPRSRGTSTTMATCDFGPCGLTLMSAENFPPLATPLRLLSSKVQVISESNFLISLFSPKIDLILAKVSWALSFEFISTFTLGMDLGVALLHGNVMRQLQLKTKDEACHEGRQGTVCLLIPRRPLYYSVLVKGVVCHF